MWLILYDIRPGGSPQASILLAEMNTFYLEA